MMRARDFGTDQTPLNLVLRREREPVWVLPPPYNFLHCFPMDEPLLALEKGPQPEPELFARTAFSRPWAFEFIGLAYVWHFTNVVAHRSLVMEEVWRRVAGHYPGAVIDGA